MFKTRFISMLVLLLMAVSGAWATITVTWNKDDITGSGKSFTKDGVTITAGSIDFGEKNFMEGGTFTTTLGNFTKIEVTTELWMASGTGWSGSTWTGTPASSVSFSGDILGMGNTKFVFTIEPATVAVTGVTLAPTSATLTLGETETVTLIPTVLPGDATDKSVTWSSSDEAVATVADGVVTAVAAGTATITVTTTDGAKTATCAVTVAAPANACGDGVTWALDNGVLTISYAGSGTGAMDDFDYEAPWSAYQDNITSVVIEDGVTSVGARAFTWCSNLTSVSLPASLEAIGAMAFARCGLTSITLPASLETIGMRAFQDTKITSVNIPASVASIDELAFGYCGSLAEITVADGNTVYEAPNGCNALIVKATHTLIQGCNGTVFANLPADLKSIGEAAFAGCTSLTTVTFPDGLESIGGNAFESCSGLTTVTIPASVNTVDVNAFAWCDNLTTVTIYATSLTTYGEGAFDDAASGLKIYVPYGSGDTYKAGWADYASKIEEMAAPATYTVTLKEGTEDATSWQGKAGTGEYQSLPLEGVAAGTAVTVKYSGTKKVKSVKAKKKAAAGPKALSAAAVGDVVGSDGLAYADIANLPEGVTAVAKVGYVNGSNGLALAMADEANKLTWSEAIETCAAHTPAINGTTWKLANKAEWNNMIEAGVFGDTDLNLKKGNWDTYWSSEEKSADQVWGYCYDPGEWSASFKDATFMYTRACLAW